MRVISGKYKGRNIKGFDIEGTRPTMDRVKESLFAIINRNLKDSTVLDLFAGSGNLGIEALSNGSKCVHFVDINNIAIKTIKENKKNINISENTCVYKMDYRDALLYFKNNNIKFDIIFLDPPYKDNILSEILVLIKEYSILNVDGLVILEYENQDINYKNYELIKQKKYGSKNIMILKK